MIGKLNVYTLIFVLLGMNNMICQLNARGGWSGLGTAKFYPNYPNNPNYPNYPNYPNFLGIFQTKVEFSI